MPVSAIPQLLCLPARQQGRGVIKFLMTLVVGLMLAIVVYLLMLRGGDQPLQEVFEPLKTQQEDIAASATRADAIDEESLTQQQLMTLKPISLNASKPSTTSLQKQASQSGFTAGSGQDVLSGTISRTPEASGTAVENHVGPNGAVPVLGASDTQSVVVNTAGTLHVLTPGGSISTVTASKNLDGSASRSASATMKASLIPMLDNSDSEVKRGLMSLDATLMLANLLIDEELIRKFVVMVDNMAAGQIPRKHSVLRPLPTAFRAVEKGDQVFLDGYNFSRYIPYVDLFISLDSKRITGLYQRYYPLMQQAYAELGYPRRSFHKRILMAVDHLLDSPVMDGAIVLVQPSVMYKYADPELEQLSDVHKQMLRMGSENARSILTRLTVLRSELMQLGHG